MPKCWRKSEEDLGFQERLTRHRTGNSILGKGPAHASARGFEEQQITAGVGK